MSPRWELYFSTLKFSLPDRCTLPPSRAQFSRGKDQFLNENRVFPGGKRQFFDLCLG